MDIQLEERTVGRVDQSLSTCPVLKVAASRFLSILGKVLCPWGPWNFFSF